MWFVFFVSIDKNKYCDQENNDKTHYFSTSDRGK
ncbi:hypothetical protein CRJUMX02_1780056 [Escherichia coli]|nr:hypothetical protein CRJUMX02_1780056 [Escherichia coli]